MKGGTNFGFMNGAIVIPWIRQFSYQSAVTSYGKYTVYISCLLRKYSLYAKDQQKKKTFRPYFGHCQANQ